MTIGVVQSFSTKRTLIAVVCSFDGGTASEMHQSNVWSGWNMSSEVEGSICSVNNGISVLVNDFGHASGFLPCVTVLKPKPLSDMNAFIASQDECGVPPRVTLDNLR